MNSYVELTQINGNSIHVMSNSVMVIKPTSIGSVISLFGNLEIMVKETSEEVKNKIEKSNNYIKTKTL